MIEVFVLGVMAEALGANIDWKSALRQELGRFGQKFQVQEVIPYQTFFMSET